MLWWRVGLDAKRKHDVASRFGETWSLGVAIGGGLFILGARYFNERSDLLVHQIPTQCHTFSRSEGIQCPTTDSSRICVNGAQPGIAVSGQLPLFTG
jgi:hypothetical protein